MSARPNPRRKKTAPPPRKPTAHTNETAATAWRTLLAVVGAAGTTGLAILTGDVLGMHPRAAVVFGLPTGILVGALFASLLVIQPAAAATAKNAEVAKRIRALMRTDRQDSFASLTEDHHQGSLGDIVAAVTEALSSAHKHRLEAASLRRELDARVEKHTKKTVAHLSKLTITDDLTGMVNRRGFEQELADMFDRALTSQQDIALLAVDLDHFKQLNDTYGHEKGDEALVAAGQIIRAAIREHDIAARVGGDELFAVLHGADETTAKNVADRLISLFSVHPASSGVVDCRWPSMTIGIATLKKSLATTPEQLRRQADAALYQGKRAGRSRCIIWRPCMGEGELKSAA